MVQSWSKQMHLHFCKHYHPGMTAVYHMPFATLDQRLLRALAAIRLYRRVCRHIETMHPAHDSQALQEAAKGDGVG